jgi:hypothetical protein
MKKFVIETHNVEYKEKFTDRVLETLCAFINKRCLHRRKSKKNGIE